MRSGSLHLLKLFALTAKSVLTTFILRKKMLEERFERELKWKEAKIVLNFLEQATTVTDSQL